MKATTVSKEEHLLAKVTGTQKECLALLKLSFCHDNFEYKPV
jgi:hypothetical protein